MIVNSDKFQAIVFDNGQSNKTDVYLFIYSFVSEEIPAASSVGKTGITIDDKLNLNFDI